MVKTSVAEPVPPELVALIVMLETPVVDGVPVMSPAASIDRPAGSPVVPYDEGVFVAVI